MTTGIALLDRVAADSFVSYEPSFTGGKKVWVAKGCLWVGAGEASKLAAFRLWTLGKGKRPVVEKEGDEESAKMEILQVKKKDGIYLWINDGIPEFVNEKFFAVGSGAPYAMGALACGKSPAEAIEIAAKWSSGTRLPVNELSFADIERRGK